MGNVPSVPCFLHNSNQAGTRDNFGSASHFGTPLIVNGKVYVGTNTNVTAFGLLKQMKPAGGPHKSAGSVKGALVLALVPRNGTSALVLGARYRSDPRFAYFGVFLPLCLSL